MKNTDRKRHLIYFCQVPARPRWRARQWRSPTFAHEGARSVPEITHFFEQLWAIATSIQNGGDVLAVSDMARPWWYQHRGTSIDVSLNVPNQHWGVPAQRFQQGPAEKFDSGDHPLSPMKVRGRYLISRTFLEPSGPLPLLSRMASMIWR